MTWWMLGLALQSVQARETEDSTPEEQQPSATEEESSPPADEEQPPPPDVDLVPTEAEELESISEEELDFFKPKRHLLDQAPYGQVDFTAYTVEWGELKVGLASWSFGVLPRLQLSTVPVLDLLGVPNGALKWGFLRAGPLDFAFNGSMYVMPLGGFVGSYTQPGGMISLRLLEAWSLHVGGSYLSIQGQGVPDLTQVSPVLYSVTGVPLDEWEQVSQLLQEEGSLDFRARGTTLRLNTDYRFNRRDSLVFQFSAIVGGEVLGNASVPLLGIDEAFDNDSVCQLQGAGDCDGRFLGSWTATLSYQITFKQLDIRLGGGASAYPFTWLFQANDVSYRMFGKTRRTESKMKSGWRENKREAD